MRNYILYFIILITNFSFSQDVEIGKSFIEKFLFKKNYEEAYSFLDEVVKSEITFSEFLEIEKLLINQFGKYNRIIEVNNEVNTYYYYVDFEKNKIDIQITINEKEKIIGFYLLPHKEFKNQNPLNTYLTIKSIDIELTGTLLIPQNNKKKLVIFIHGSGAQDRDESIFENKPFKDIAEKLYLSGISSYRFDKRTFLYPNSLNENSTIDDEVTNDVLNVINFFKKDSIFKEFEIILIGHSFGGYLLPRIKNKTNYVSKLIFLAANSRPIDKLILEQYQYLYTINPSEILGNEINKIKEKIEFLNSKKFNLQSPKEKLPLNLPAYYWKSILDYDLEKEIKNIKTPVMIIQGERDYQVTMKDFIIWKKLLKNNNKNYFKVYPKLNHIFMEGEGLSKPDEYLFKGVVSDLLIKDIEDFIINF